MTPGLQNSRNSCALHGALATLGAVPGVAPVIHSTAGCGAQGYWGVNRLAGQSGSGHAGGLFASSSSVIEKHIVFGGTSRLREEIKNAVKTISADLYLVVTGCAVEVVGDDVAAMVKEAQEQSFPVAHLQTPGFNGDTHRGYEIAMRGLEEAVNRLPQAEREPSAGLVNVLGIVPGQHPYAEGDLETLRQLGTLAGMEVNTLLTHVDSVASWGKFPQAEVNWVFSPWGMSLARDWQKKYGIPYVDFGSLPVGAAATADFLRMVAGRSEEARAAVEKSAAEATRREDFYLEKLIDAYVDFDLQKSFSFVGESLYAAGIVHFLADTFGLVPETVVLTDIPIPEIQAHIRAREEPWLARFGAELIFEEDARLIAGHLGARPPELILGSYLERAVAERLGVPLHEISFPLPGEMVLAKSYAGFGGGVRLIEDLSRTLLQEAQV